LLAFLFVDDYSQTSISTVVIDAVSHIINIDSARAIAKKYGSMDISIFITIKLSIYICAGN
jgi:hypothetical protein